MCLFPWRKTQLCTFIVQLLTLLTSVASPSLYASDTDALKTKPCSNDIAQTSHMAECFSLAVPENRDQPKGKQLELNIVRIPAINSTQASPLFIIAGGPGQAASDLTGRFRHLFRRLNQNRDLIFTDQRGTGLSAPLKCDLSNLDISQSSLIQHREQMEIIQRCVDGYGADLNYYSTYFAVQDLEQIRQALNYKQVNLWGASYGTRVALEFMKQFPDSVRTTVLDGVAPYEIQLPLHAADDTSGALREIFTLCDTQPSCTKAFPNLLQDWQGVREQLARSPSQVTLIHPRTQTPQEVFVDQTIVSSWLRMSLYFRDLAPLIPMAIHKASQGDFSLLYSFSTFSEGVTDSISTGMQLAVLCTEDFRFSPSLPVDTRPPLLDLPPQEMTRQLCQAFPEGHVQNKMQPTQSDAPTLLLSGKLDPATPPRWAERAAQTLVNSEHFIVNGAHHGVTSLGCVSDLIQHFVEHTRTQDFDVNCLDDIKPVHLFIDTAGPELTYSAGEVSDD